MQNQSLWSMLQGSISGRAISKRNKTQKIINGAVCALFFGIMLFISSGSSFGATYYVSASSTNTAWSTCTNSNTPCTPVTAMNNAKAGDIVNFLAGTYNLPCNTSYYEDSSLEPANSGTSGNPITFQANPGATVKLVGNAGWQTGSTCDDGGVIGVNSKSYITISGFIVDTSGFPTGNVRTGIRLQNAISHIIVQNNEVIGHTTTVTDNFAGIYPPASVGSTDVTIKNNKIHGWYGGDNVHAGNGIGGVYLIDNLTIVNNEIYDNNGMGILFKEGGNNIDIHYNYIHDIGGNGVHIWTQNGYSMNNFNIYQNIFVNTGSYNSPGADGAGVVMDSSTVSGMYFTNINVYNNVFYNAGHTQYTHNQNTGQFYNNIVYLGSLDTAHYMFDTKSDGSALTLIDYNCWYDSISGTPNWYLDVYGSSPQTYSFSQWQAAGYDTHGYNTNPLFVNASSGPTGFKLQNGSACRNGSGGPMGAYITGNEIIGVAGTEIPNPPPSVAVQ